MMAWFMFIIAALIFFALVDDNYKSGLKKGVYVFPVLVFENGTSASHLDKSNRQCHLVTFTSKPPTVAPYEQIIVCESLTPEPNTTLKLSGSKVRVSINTTNLVKTYEAWSQEVISEMHERLSAQLNETTEANSTTGKPSVSSVSATQLPTSATPTETSTPSTMPTQEPSPGCGIQPEDMDLFMYYKSSAEKLWYSRMLNVVLGVCLVVVAMLCLLLLKLQREEPRLSQRYQQGKKYEAIPVAEERELSAEDEKRPESPGQKV
jgi:hypothetical protein